MTRLRRWTAVVLLPFAAGCSSLQPVPVGFISETKPQLIYLSDAYGAVQGVANPRLSGDTVLGTSVGQNVDVAVPLTDVERITTMRPNRGRTALLVAGLTVAGALAAYGFFSTSGGQSTTICTTQQCAYPQ